MTEGRLIFAYPAANRRSSRDECRSVSKGCLWLSSARGAKFPNEGQLGLRAFAKPLGAWATAQRNVASGVIWLRSGGSETHRLIALQYKCRSPEVVPTVIDPTVATRRRARFGVMPPRKSEAGTGEAVSCGGTERPTRTFSGRHYVHASHYVDASMRFRNRSNR